MHDTFGLGKQDFVFVLGWIDLNVTPGVVNTLAAVGAGVRTVDSSGISSVVGVRCTPGLTFTCSIVAGLGGCRVMRVIPFCRVPDNVTS